MTQASARDTIFVNMELDVTASPTVSVVIAAHNRGAAIAPTLISVLEQTVASTEIIVVDDGSIDDTASYVERAFPIVRVIRIANRGTSGARNAGARLARGEVLIFLDHDDQMHPTAIEELSRSLATSPDVRAAFCDHAYQDTVRGKHFDNHHGRLPSFDRLKSIGGEVGSDTRRIYRGRTMYRALASGNILQQPWAIWRDSFLLLGGFDESIRYCEDWDMYLRVANAFAVVVSDDVISTHTIEGGNLHLRPDQDEMHLHVIRKHLRLQRLRDIRAYLTFRQKLAGYYKMFGDRDYFTNGRRAWLAYWQSFVAWPFDYVVAARLLLWSPVLSSKQSPP